MGLLDAVGSAVTAAADSASAAESGGGGGGIATAGKLLSAVTDSFEKAGVDLGPIDDVLQGAMEGFASRGLGGALDGALDGLGMPDWLGDIAGGVLDFCSGNYVGVAEAGLDILGDVAKACGGKELAGFLEAARNITGMFAGNMNISMSNAGQILGEVSESIGMIEDALGGKEAEGEAGAQLAEMADADPQSLEMTKDLLGRASTRAGEVDISAHQGSALRA